MPIFGWDASNHDWGRGPMDLAAAVRDGIQFFTHKATEGTGYRDPYLGRAIQRARDAGMPVYGAYMVPRSGTPVRSQVDFFLSYLDQQVPGWRTDQRFRILQMDTEHWSNDKVSATIGAQACELLRPLGKYVIHYAPAWAYGNSIPGPDPLWASAYGTNPATGYRQAYPGDRAWPAPYSGRTPGIWQFGSRVRIGTQSTCDINAIRDPQVWAALTGGGDLMALSDAQQSELVRNAHNADWGVTQILQGTDPAAGFNQIGGGSFTVKNELHRKLDGILAAVDGVQAGGQPTQEQVDAAVLAAMRDPGVQAGIGAAIASHLHVT